jgi:hypothetical protein
MLQNKEEVIDKLSEKKKFSGILNDDTTQLEKLVLWKTAKLLPTKSYICLKLQKRSNPISFFVGVLVDWVGTLEITM